MPLFTSPAPKSQTKNTMEKKRKQKEITYGKFIQNALTDSWDEQFGRGDNENYTKGIQFVKELIVKYAGDKLI